MTRRVVIGLLPSGNYGLRVSRPGFDAWSDSSSVDGQFSFDSDWTDLVKVHQAGTFTAPNFNVPPYVATATIAFPDLGYKPFMEIRTISGDKVWDDRYTSLRIGAAPLIYSDRFVQQNNYTDSYDFLYIVYKVAVPTQ